MRLACLFINTNTSHFLYEQNHKTALNLVIYSLQPVVSLLTPLNKQSLIVL